jgi:hypothetical protein
MGGSGVTVLVWRRCALSGLNGSVWRRWALSGLNGSVWRRPRWALSKLNGFVVVVAATCACSLVGSGAALGVCG